MKTRPVSVRSLLLFAFGSIALFLPSSFAQTPPQQNSSGTSPASPVPMAANASPSFEVATIKPASPDENGHGFPSRGRDFSARNCTVNDLLRFAYGIQAEQIVDGPAWLDKDRFDISGVPDAEGQPSAQQWKIMLQKLLADRFRLAYHSEKRVLPVYLLSVGKNGPKLTPTKSDDPVTGALNMRMSRDGFVFVSHGGTVAEFASALQGAVLNRPVVDQTGLSGRFDFQITFAPGGTEFGGAHLPGQSEDSSAPSLFTVIQDLGLKLEATNAPIEALVIDHIEKPPPN